MGESPTLPRVACSVGRSLPTHLQPDPRKTAGYPKHPTANNHQTLIAIPVKDSNMHILKAAIGPQAHSREVRHG